METTSTERLRNNHEERSEPGLGFRNLSTLRICAVFFMLAYAGTSFADESPVAPNSPTAIAPLAPIGMKEETEQKSKNEKWYWMWSLGMSSLNYSGETKAVVNTTNADHRRISMTADLFGFYLRFKRPRTIFGVVLSGTWDSLTSNGGSDRSISITQVQFGPSVIHFFGQNVGDGFFLRGDIGISSISITADKFYQLWTPTEHTGPGFLLGVGYAVPISRGTRILFGANYSLKMIPNEPFGTFTGNVGWLY